MSDDRISPDDITKKFKELQTDLEIQADSAKSMLTIGGVAGLVVLLLVAFVMGSRRGKKKTTFVEIRRV